jgi:hypothetical protein
MKKKKPAYNIVIKINDDFDHDKLEFTLPDGRILSVYQIDYEDVYTGNEVEPSQYRYAAYGDYYGFDIEEFDGKTVVEYDIGFKRYDEDLLKFCKKVCLYYCKATQFDSGLVDFTMPGRYLELWEGK